MSSMSYVSSYIHCDREPGGTPSQDNLSGGIPGFAQETPHCVRCALPSSLLKKPPGEGTGPTIYVDFRGNPVGRVPSHGERDVFQQAARGVNFSRPFGTWSIRALLPTLKRWAIVVRSLRDVTSD